MSTKIFQSLRDNLKPELGDLLVRAWSPTPWIVDAYDGPSLSLRRQDMTDWCRENFGEECSVIYGRVGTWQRGDVTINGWTWFGFSTEEQMQDFLNAWPTPPE